MLLLAGFEQWFREMVKNGFSDSELETGMHLPKFIQAICLTGNPPKPEHTCKHL